MKHVLVVWAMAGLLALAANVTAADSPRWEGVDPENTKVPQTLLSLVHTPEVQRELGVDDGNRPIFEKGLREIDAVWWPSRLLPADKQRQMIADLEQKLIAHMEQVLGTSAIDRLQEIEYQSQGIRVLARPEVAQKLQLDNDQIRRINALFQETDQLAADIDSAKPDEGRLKGLQKARSKETKAAQDLMSRKQLQALQELLGKRIGLTRIERIYPLAPELISTEHQYGDGVVQLEKLKGKVVLVHFYAFQCHNCVANYKHYKRWSETLKTRGVEVIGIQTPETKTERDPQQVSAAAKREGFQFPVIIDLENKNWDAWGNTMWPTVYVIDKQGYIRMWWQGELNWNGATGDKKIEDLVDRLLSEFP